MSLFPMISPAAADPAVTTSLESNGTTGSGATVYTFSSQTLGAAAAGRKLVICTTMDATAAPYSFGVSSITVEGESCTQIIEHHGTAPNHLQGGGIWYIDKADDTTGDIVITYARAASLGSFALFAVYNADAGAPADTYSEGNKTESPQAVSIDVEAAGGAIYYGWWVNNGGSDVYTAVGLDEDFEANLSYGPYGQYHTGGHKVFADAQSSLTVSIDNSDTGSGQGLIVLTFDLNA